MSSQEVKTTSGILYKILAVACICSTVVNLTLLTISLSAGRWVFGDLLCQLFAFVSHVLVAGAIWLIALSSFERYFILVLPDEHPSLFSEINTKLLVIGLYLSVAFVMFNPIYGWGEYSEYRGSFKLIVQISQQYDSKVHSNQPIPGNTSSTSGLTEQHSTDVCLGLNDVHYDYPCEFNNASHLSKYLISGLRQNDFYTTVLIVSKNMIVLSIRTSNAENLVPLVRHYKNKTITDFLLKEPYGCKMGNHSVCVNYILNQTQLEEYSKVFLPFQATRMCTVDFTTINKGAWGWNLVFVLLTAVGPYLVISACLWMIYAKRNDIKLEHYTQKDIVQVKQYVYGCVLSGMFYLPYYVINLINYFGNYVSPFLTITVMVMYYTSPLIPCMFLRPMCVCRQGTQSPTTLSIQESDTKDKEKIEMDILIDVHHTRSMSV